MARVDRSPWRGLVRCQRCGQKQPHKLEHFKKVAVIREEPIGCERCGYHYGTYARG
jgi:ribosomal protein S14